MRRREFSEHVDGCMVFTWSLLVQLPVDIIFLLLSVADIFRPFLSNKHRKIILIYVLSAVSLSYILAQSSGTLSTRR